MCVTPLCGSTRGPEDEGYWQSLINPQIGISKQREGLHHTQHRRDPTAMNRHRRT